MIGHAIAARAATSAAVSSASQPRPSAKVMTGGTTGAQSSDLLALEAGPR
jgi:hypothetical protein